MKILIYMLIALISAASSAAALKWSDRERVEEATRAIRMADALATGTPQAISCSIQLAPTTPGSPGVDRNRVTPTATIDSGPTYTNLLSAMTTKINNDKATAEAYLAAQGVTND